MSRYIDADKLLQEFFNVDEEEWTTPEIRAILENAPTIITSTVSEDCISRQQAIEAYNEAIGELVEIQKKELGCIHFSECAFDTTECQLIAQKIESLPPVTPTERTGWIPVGERLPKEEKTVLTCDARGGIVFGRYSKGKWYWEAEACADYWTRDDSVIAWMPLPEPYKAESEDKE